MVLPVVQFVRHETVNMIQASKLRLANIITHMLVAAARASFTIKLKDIITSGS